jgi:hypothetical protein
VQDPARTWNAVVVERLTVGQPAQPGAVGPCGRISSVNGAIRLRIRPLQRVVVGVGHEPVQVGDHLLDVVSDREPPSRGASAVPLGDRGERGRHSVQPGEVSVGPVRLGEAQHRQMG